jgi:hypothetical protein
MSEYIDEFIDCDCGCGKSVNHPSGECKESRKERARRQKEMTRNQILMDTFGKYMIKEDKP